MNNNLSPELHRMQAIWPELNEGMRFNLLALASLSLLRHGKVKPGLMALASSLNYRARLFVRDTGSDIVMIGRQVSKMITSQ